ncbi:MAG: hypothetical protein WD200_02580 [Candidatus Andersenbacteria bacterium]
MLNSLPTSSNTFLKESICPLFNPTTSSVDLKHDFRGVYGSSLWDEMDDFLDVFPLAFAFGSPVDMIDGGEWDIRLVEGEVIDFIGLGIRSVFAATASSIAHAGEIHSETLVERLAYFSVLPHKFRPGISAEAESRWFNTYLPHDSLASVADILTEGFQGKTYVSPRPEYAEKRIIILHDVPKGEEEFSDFISDFSANCSDFDDLVSELDWEENSLTKTRKLFEIEIVLYLPVLTPEYLALPSEVQWQFTPSR